MAASISPTRRTGGWSTTASRDRRSSAFAACTAPSPTDGVSRCSHDDFGQPNGLCFSVDENRLFVNDTERMHIRIFDVLADGTLGKGRIWAELSGEGAGAPDGMKIDSAENLFCCGPGGIHVFDPTARCLGVIRVPHAAANFTWGDDDLRSLFITATSMLYRIRVSVPGR